MRGTVFVMLWNRLNVSLEVHLVEIVPRLYLIIQFLSPLDNRKTGGPINLSTYSIWYWSSRYNVGLLSLFWICVISWKIFEFKINIFKLLHFKNFSPVINMMEIQLRNLICFKFLVGNKKFHLPYLGILRQELADI